MSVHDSFSLTGRVVVVTGGARGLGSAASLALGEAGATVVVTGRDEQALKSVVKRLRELGHEADSEVLDVTGEVDARRVMAQITERHGPIRALINNAGVAHQAMAVATTAQAFENVMQVNLHGAFLCTRALLQQRDNGSASLSVVNFSSIAAVSGVATQSAYCASKGAVESLTRAMAVESAASNVRVNALAPGYFRTDMPAAVLDDPEQERRLLRKIPAGRIPGAEEIGPPVVFLASDASAYMTGAVLRFDGGYTAL